MKKIFDIRYIIILFTGIALAACTKDKKTNDDTTQTGTLMLHLHTNIGTNEVENYDTVYANEDGRQISLSIAQLYISKIQLIKADGSTYDVEGTKILKTLDAELYLIGNVPVGNYKSVKFKVGLDANTTSSLSDTLLNQSAMWFSNTLPANADGYIFANIQGMIDTTASMSGALIPFAYSIGTNANYTQVTMPEEKFSVIQNQIGYIHLTVDYGKIFNGIQLNQSSNLSVTNSSDNTTTLAQQIANNIPKMFSYEE